MRIPILTLFTCACNASTPTPAQQAAVAAETLEDTACVTNAEAGTGKAALQAEIDACRAKVRAKWHDGSTAK